MGSTRGLSYTPAPYWPNAKTTGYRIALTPASSNTINTSGTYSGLSFNGVVTISASNVTLVDCLITANNPDPWSLQVMNNVSNVLVQNITIIGAGGTTTNGGAAYGFYASDNSQVTFLACDISRVGQNAINNGNVLVKDCYIHDLLSDPSTHYECIYYGGAGGANPSFSLDIEHNTFLNEQPQTAAIFIENFFGAVNNVTVNNNLLVGGDFTIYVSGVGTPANNVTNVNITHNAMGTGIFGYTDYTAGTGLYQVNHVNSYDWITGVAVP